MESRWRILWEYKAIPEADRAAMGAKHTAEAGKASDELSH